jgi:multiple sugar transport system substrate-binding protein
VLWSNGGQLLNPDGTKVAFGSPAGVTALTLWQNLVRKDHAAPATSFAQAGSYDGAPAFAGHTVSMIVEGQWAVSEFNTAKVKSATNIGIGVASVFDHGPAANGGLPSAPDQLQQPLVRKEASSQPAYQTFASQLSTGHTRPTAPAYTAISLALATEINAALTSNISPAQALAKAAAAGNQAIASGSGS